MNKEYDEIRIFFQSKLGNKLPGNFLIKRILDVLVSVLLIIILTPILLIIALIIKCDSSGGALFKQRRIGMYGEVFEIFKFRTMVENAENMGTGLFSYEGDQRITKVGSILRASSLDELPQLINVLKGDMSLVGPRPPVENELGDFSSLSVRYKKRFMMRPGITGLAQVEGRNEHSWEEKIAFDNSYIDNFCKKNIVLDIIIMFKTFTRVLKSSGVVEENKFSDNAVEASHLADENVKKLAHTYDWQDKEFKNFRKLHYEL